MPKPYPEEFRNELGGQRPTPQLAGMECGPCRTKTKGPYSASAPASAELAAPGIRPRIAVRVDSYQAAAATG